MRFAVFTHVIHQEKEGRYYAYSPYVREMNLWFKYVEEVEILAPLEERRRKGEKGKRGSGEKEMRGKGELYEQSCITFTKIPSFHLLNFPAVLDSIIKIPFIFFRILGAMRRADHLHLRCPGNIGLLAAVAQIFFPKKPKTVKYAGNWDPGSRQPWTYRLQKWILSNTFLSRNIKVLAYGVWPNQSENILPFFTASFSEIEKESVQKDFSPPYKFIFTGNLVEGKGIFKAIKLIEALNGKGVNSELEIYGDGILKDSLNDYIQKKKLQKFVKLKGRKSLEGLKDAYIKAHFVILLSKSEGWPKTIAEGMWYGCVPVATDVSCVAWMLGDGSRGILISDVEKRKERREKREENVEKPKKNCQFECPDGSRDVSRTGFSETDIERIVSLLKNPANLEQMSRAAQEWSQQYTLERFEAEIKKLLVRKEA
ncbi:glycosyltransferase [Salegentibacter sp. LM13S]|uniref:glycosyltransferase n=1 Tax=Salegentibacter lacus TaxID=2873599 RepID=UPI001CD01CF1|nr:glycosyltransferase [Salegentibacter lacus]MBZ9632372.1 glycosyltransferase [Salegentibacter lacus]